MCFVTAALASDKAPSGSVEGRIITAITPPVQLDEPGATAAKPDYTSFALLIRSADEAKQIVKVTPDRAGKYRAALPPGQYVIELQQPGNTPLRTVRQKFVVTADTTTRVDIGIAADLRAVTPEHLDH